MTTTEELFYETKEAWHEVNKKLMHLRMELRRERNAKLVGRYFRDFRDVTRKCDTCKVMVGETVQGDSYLDHKCSEIFDYKKCPGTFRPLTWGDLAPIKKEKP